MKSLYLGYAVLTAALILGCANHPKVVAPSDRHQVLYTPNQEEGEPAKRTNENGKWFPFVSPVIHFQFNSSELLEAETLKLQAASTGFKGVCTVEGNASSEGTSDYNLALGMSRAQSVIEYLSQITQTSALFNPISYGEENPVSHDVSEYWMDRRVEIHCL